MAGAQGLDGRGHARAVRAGGAERRSCAHVGRRRPRRYIRKVDDISYRMSAMGDKVDELRAQLLPVDGDAGS